MNHRSAEERYAAMMGDDRLAQQRDLAKLYHRCCGEPVKGPHHVSCARFVPDERPTVIDGQESLL